MNLLDHFIRLSLCSVEQHRLVHHDDCTGVDHFVYCIPVESLPNRIGANVGVELVVPFRDGLLDFYKRDLGLFFHKLSSGLSCANHELLSLFGKKLELTFGIGLCSTEGVELFRLKFTTCLEQINVFVLGYLCLG